MPAAPAAHGGALRRGTAGRGLALVLALAITAACGSTVPLDQASGDRTGEVELSGGDPSAPGADGRPVGGPGGEAIADAAAAAGGTTGRPDTGVASSPGRSLAPASPGGKLPPLEVGIVTSETGAAATALGYGGGTSSAQAAYTTLIDGVNKRGGVAGRTITPVWFTYDATGADEATQEQAMCAQFTQDHRVFAALVLSFAGDVLRTCLNKADVFTVSQGGLTNADDRTFAEYPRFANAGSLRLEPMADAYVEGLVRLGFFTKGARIGLVTSDLPPFVRASEGPLRRALARHGLEVDQEARVRAFYRIGGLAESTPGAQNAVLRFSSAGITHVMFLGGVGGNTLLFMSSAESQGYRPRYGLTSNDQYEGLVQTVPVAQLRKAVGIGWFPLGDDAGALERIGPSGKRCVDTLRAAGHTAEGASAVGNLLRWCDHVNVLVAALERAGPQLSSAGAMRGLEAIGSALESAAFLGMSFGPGRHDGISAVRGVAFDDACSCFRYVGEVVRL